MPRLYQISLRTVFELFFVVAIALAFIYWRNQPSPAPAGRYQFITTAPGDQRGVFIDTKTGKAWRGWLNSGHWEPMITPVDSPTPSPPVAIPFAPKKAPAMSPTTPSN